MGRYIYNGQVQLKYGRKGKYVEWSNYSSGPVRNVYQNYEWTSDKKCHYCKKPVPDAYLFYESTNGRTVFGHVDCFKQKAGTEVSCATCKEAVTEGGFLTGHSDNIRHVRCEREGIKPSCSECQEDIEDLSSAIRADKVFTHKRCVQTQFTCTSCGEEISNVKKSVLDRGALYHIKCYMEDNREDCDICEKSITSVKSRLEIRSNVYHVACYRTTARRCKGCRDEIKGDVTTLFKGGALYHRKCWFASHTIRCRDCKKDGKKDVDDFCTDGNRISHWDCGTASKQCHGCRESITRGEELISFKKAYFHRKCLEDSTTVRCDLCKDPLEKKFWSRGYCHGCRLRHKMVAEKEGLA